MLKLQRYFSVLLLLSVGGCDWAGGLHNRLFNDPTRVVRVTTKDGDSAVLMQPEVDYLYPIGPGRFDRSAFKEGRGLRTTDGIIEWPAFTAVTIGRSRRTSGDVIGGGDIIYEADVQLRNGASAVKQLLEGRAMAGFTFNNGERRTYPMRDAYFHIKYTTNIACERVNLFELRSIAVARAS